MFKKSKKNQRKIKTDKSRQKKRRKEEAMESLLKAWECPVIDLPIPDIKQEFPIFDFSAFGKDLTFDIPEIDYNHNIDFKISKKRKNRNHKKEGFPAPAKSNI